MNQPASPSRFFAAAVSEWLLVLPPAFLLAAAALRIMQPPQYEPARTSWMIFDWATTHISHAGAGLLFIGLPLVAVAVGCTALLLAWRRNQALRQDTFTLFANLWRHLSVAILASGTLLAGLILAAVLIHIITD